MWFPLSLQVYLKAPMILNGVCVIWKGWIDLQRLDGMGYLEYDDERAQVSAALLFTQMSFPRQETNYDLSLLSFVLAARGRAGSGRVRRGSTQDERLWGQRAIAQRGFRGERRGIADYLSQILTLSWNLSQSCKAGPKWVCCGEQNKKPLCSSFTHAGLSVMLQQQCSEHKLQLWKSQQSLTCNYFLRCILVWKRELKGKKAHFYVTDWLCRTAQSKQHHQHSLLVVHFLVCNKSAQWKWFWSSAEFSHRCFQTLKVEKHQSALKVEKY